MKEEDNEPVEGASEIGPSTPVPGSDKWIPCEELEKAALKARLPCKVRKVKADTPEIFRAVSELKWLIEQGLHGDEPWRDLMSILSHAIHGDDLSAFDDFAKAWTIVKVKPHDFTYAGQYIPSIPDGAEQEVVREPITLLVIEAVRQLQRDLERLPDRSEIADFVSKKLEKGISDTEISRQLKKLGWADKIPKKNRKSPKPAQRLEVKPAPIPDETIQGLLNCRRSLVEIRRPGDFLRPIIPKKKRSLPSFAGTVLEVR